jgi:predicted RNase H-like HicB family nuclease
VPYSCYNYGKDKWKWRDTMHNEFTAIIEKDEDWYIAYCPEIHGANGQGKTKEERLKSLSEAIKLILENRRQDVMKGIPQDAVSEVVAVE